MGEPETPTEDLILVGTIERPHGLRGEVVVNPFTDFPDARFVPGARFVAGRGTAGPPADTSQALRIEDVRWHNDRPLVRFAGVDDVLAAEGLRGRSLWIAAASRPALEPGLFYETDLVGCQVETEAGEPVGPVARVDGVPGASVLVVATPGGPDRAAGEVLVPLAEPICRVIDPVARRIVIDPPAGLLDLNAAPALSRAERRGHGRRERGKPR
jgi:16S rRNA processing protein RimM